MTIYPKGSFTGRYEPSPEAAIAQADHVIGHEFGAPRQGNGPGRVNTALAEFIIEHFPDLPVIPAATINEALQQLDPNIEILGTLNHASAKTIDLDNGTWGELRQAKKIADGKYRRPVIVAQAYHVARVALQAKKQGIEPIVPSGLPALFDSESWQWWCHDRALWATRQIPGNLVLKLAHKL